MTTWPNLTKACKLLGAHGISPEPLAIIRDNLDLFGVSVRREFDDFMRRACELFAPATDDDENGDFEV